MLLNAVVVVLRETLEAAVLYSVLLAVANRQRVPGGWLWIGLLLGLLGAVTYMWNLQAISTWFDYVGQEVVSAFVQLLVYVGLLLLVWWMHRPGKLQAIPARILLAAIIMCALVREGGEVLVFYSGFWLSGESLINAVTSGFVGLMIGASVGGVCYFLLMLLPSRSVLLIEHLVLALIAAGMVAQAVQLLLQADWLPTTQVVWNTNPWLPEQSVLGTLAYAVLGYEATPSLLQISCYTLALVLILSVMVVGVSRPKNIVEATAHE